MPGAQSPLSVPEGDPAVDFTQTHQVIVNVGHGRACEVARRLEDNNVIVNYQALPTDEGFTVSSGLRLGVAEMTRFGMKESDFEAFAPLFAEAIDGRVNAAEQVASFTAGFFQCSTVSTIRHWGR